MKHVVIFELSILINGKGVVDEKTFEDVPA
jgi:hypothetical protein